MVRNALALGTVWAQTRILLNYLIRPQQQRRRDRQPKSLGGLDVDEILMTGNYLKRVVGRDGIEPPTPGFSVLRPSTWKCA